MISLTGEGGHMLPSIGEIRYNIRIVVKGTTASTIVALLAGQFPYPNWLDVLTAKRMNPLTLLAPIVAKPMLVVYAISA